MAINILLADSGHLYRDILQTALAGEDAQITLVGSIAEAMAVVEKGQFHCFILAWQLADGDGLDLSRKLRDARIAPYEPIVILTASPSTELAEAASNAGATELFRKQDVGELVTFLRRFLKVHGQMPCSVLYVEDARDQQQHLRAHMLAWGMEVDAFGSADEAWTAILAKNYDMLVCDIVLGGRMSGSRFINRIRRQPAPLGNILILAATAFDNPARRIELFHIGIDDYVVKPILPLELKARIQNLLARKRSEEALRLAKQRAEEASTVKSAFLANMSHELRTPFHGILGTIALARSRMADAKGQELLDKAKLSTEHLLNVINDVLDISKIEANRMVLESVGFKLMPILENVQSLLGPKLEAKGLALRLELPPLLVRRELIGDPTRLAQVLINLAGNAVKFTERGSVSIRVVELGATESGLKLRFEVADTGIGIAPEDRQRLFAAFEQVDTSTARRFGGTGLGLAISKRLVDLMGGEIGVESSPGQGSTFWFEITLPEAQVQADDDSVQAQDSYEERVRREHAGKRILVVEDEPINQEVSRMMLEEVGLLPVLAENGKRALQMAGESRYDLILMDMQMPIMNGLDASLAIRADTLNRDTPILAMTANAFAEDRERCLMAGMRDHIPKPVIPEQLYETLYRWLGRAEP